MEPAALPTLLGHAFDGQRLVAILQTLHHCFLPQRVPLLPLLRNMTKAPRFDVALLFLEAAVRAPPLTLLPQYVFFLFLS